MSKGIKLARLLDADKELGDHFQFAFYQYMLARDASDHRKCDAWYGMMQHFKAATDNIGKDMCSLLK